VGRTEIANVLESICTVLRDYLLFHTRRLSLSFI
jgi:hypothetical protein